MGGLKTTGGSAVSPKLSSKKIEWENPLHIEAISLAAENHWGTRTETSFAKAQKGEPYSSDDEASSINPECAERSFKHIRTNKYNYSNIKWNADPNLLVKH